MTETWTVVRTRMLWDAATRTWSYPTETLTTVATKGTADRLLRRYPGEAVAYPNPRES